MITPAHTDLAYSLTRQYFGEKVATIIKILFHHDQASLRLLKSSCPSDLKLADIKRSLLILVKYQLVDYVKTVKNFRQQYEYSIVPTRIFAFFRMASFLQSIGSKEGHLAQLILQVLSERALLVQNRLVQVVLSKVNQAESDDPEYPKNSVKIEELIEKFITMHYIVRTGRNLSINIERMSRDYRDKLIIETVHKHYGNDSRVKALCQAILELTIENTSDDAISTAPSTMSDLVSKLVPEHFSDKDQLERYLAKLTAETNNRFFVSSGVHSNKGSMFSINIGLVINYLVKEHLSSVVETRFGPKCSRVFRVILMRGPLLLKQIEEFIMLPARDVREYSYMLMKEGYLRNRQVPKTLDYAPGKSIFMLSAELRQIVLSVSDLSCRSMTNLIIRHDYEFSKNKFLLDKSREFNEMHVAQDDWNQYFTSHELTQLDHTSKILNKLHLARIQTDETLFILQTWCILSPNFEDD